MTIYASYYEGTLQEKLFELVAIKLEAAHQVFALNVGEALRTAGTDPWDAATSISIGEALYESLTGYTRRAHGAGAPGPPPTETTTRSEAL